MGAPDPMTPNSRDELPTLIERVEAAVGPDRELDFLVWAAFNGITEITYPTEGHPMTPGRGGRVEGRGPDGKWHLYGWIDPGQVARNWSPYGGDTAYPAYTSSLDAAITLVPEGCRWIMPFPNEAAILKGQTAFQPFAKQCATPALALTAACLRAHAASVGRNAERHDPEEGRGPKDEHAVPEGQAPTPSRSSTIARKE